MSSTLRTEAVKLDLFPHAFRLFRCLLAPLLNIKHYCKMFFHFSHLGSASHTLPIPLSPDSPPPHPVSRVFLLASFLVCTKSMSPLPYLSNFRKLCLVFSLLFTFAGGGVGHFFVVQELIDHLRD